MQVDEASDSLDRVFAALADPTRREILAQLGRGEATVGELAAPHPISLPAVSRHLKVLEQAGLIDRSRRAQWRTNRLRPDPLREATAWMEHLTTLWNDRFDRLDAHLAQLARGGTAAPEAPKRPAGDTSDTPDEGTDRD